MIHNVPHQSNLELTIVVVLTCSLAPTGHTDPSFEHPDQMQGHLSSRAIFERGCNQVLRETRLSETSPFVQILHNQRSSARRIHLRALHERRRAASAIQRPAQQIVVQNEDTVQL